MKTTKAAMTNLVDQKSALLLTCIMAMGEVKASMMNEIWENPRKPKSFLGMIDTFLNSFTGVQLQFLQCVYTLE